MYRITVEPLTEERLAILAGLSSEAITQSHRREVILGLVRYALKIAFERGKGSDEANSAAVYGLVYAVERAIDFREIRAYVRPFIYDEIRKALLPPVPVPKEVYAKTKEIGAFIEIGRVNDEDERELHVDPESHVSGDIIRVCKTEEERLLVELWLQGHNAVELATLAQVDPCTIRTRLRKICSRYVRDAEKPASGQSKQTQLS